MKNPIAPLSPVYLAGTLLMAASSVVVYTAAFRGSRRATAVALALGTLAGVALAFAPSALETPPPNPQKEQRDSLARDIAAAVRAGNWQHAGELVNAGAQAHAQHQATN